MNSPDASAKTLSNVVPRIYVALPDAGAADVTLSKSESPVRLLLEKSPLHEQLDQFLATPWPLENKLFEFFPSRGVVMFQPNQAGAQELPLVPMGV